jgi:hypothetical protein
MELLVYKLCRDGPMIRKEPYKEQH